MDSYSELFNAMEGIHNFYFPSNFDEFFFNLWFPRQQKQMFKWSLLEWTKKTITYSMLMSCLFVSSFLSMSCLGTFLESVVLTDLLYLSLSQTYLGLKGNNTYFMSYILIGYS